MENSNKYEEVVKSSLEGIKKMLDSNTVVGETINLENGTSIIPISKMTVGFATGALNSDGKKEEVTLTKKGPRFGGGGGSGLALTPVGFLIVGKDGKTSFINVNDQKCDPVEIVSDILDRTPELVEKIKALFKKPKDETEGNE